MICYIREWAVCYAALIILDLLWLGLVAQPWYAQGFAQFTKHGAPSISWPAALATWALMVVGLQYFVAPLMTASYIPALVSSIFFGIVVYGVYDLTNLATIAGYPLWLAVMDILWGSLVYGILGSIVWIMRFKW